LILIHSVDDIVPFIKWDIKKKWESADSDRLFGDVVGALIGSSPYVFNSLNGGGGGAFFSSFGDSGGLFNPQGPILAQQQPNPQPNSQPNPQPTQQYMRRDNYSGHGN
jgi:hypothetical protein